MFSKFFLLNNLNDIIKIKNRKVYSSDYAYNEQSTRFQFVIEFFIIIITLIVCSLSCYIHKFSKPKKKHTILHYLLVGK